MLPECTIYHFYYCIKIILLCFPQLCVSDTGSLEVISEGKIGSANLTTEGAQTKSADMELKQAEKPGNCSLDISG